MIRARRSERLRRQLLEWKSLPGSAIHTSGILRLERLPGSTTRVDLNLSYIAPAGALDHGAASLFGADPKQAVDEDLNRLKVLLEPAKVKIDGAAIAGFSAGNQQAWEHAT